jgi:hypothetical protein
MPGELPSGTAHRLYDPLHRLAARIRLRNKASSWNHFPDKSMDIFRDMKSLDFVRRQGSSAG